MVKRRNPKEQSARKRGCRRVNETSGDASASLRSVTTVSLSDVDLSELRDDATSRPRRPTVVSLVDLESSSTTTENDTSDGDGCDSGPEANEGKRSPRATQTEEAFQQQLSVLKCRYKAELEKIEDEIAAAENCYFGTRRTRVGSILKGYGDYGTCNMDPVRSKSYCKPVKLGERAFSLSSRSSKIHKEFEEECKNEALRREAQLAAGYNYYTPGLEPQGLDPSLHNLPPRMGMEYYPTSCQTDPYGYNMAGQVPGEGHPYGQHGYASYLYAPQNPHLFMNYESRPSVPVQSPQMMGPSMRIASASQPYLASLESGDPTVSLAQTDYGMNGHASLRRPEGEEEPNGGDSTFNVEQFLNVKPDTSHRPEK